MMEIALKSKTFEGKKAAIPAITPKYAGLGVLVAQAWRSDVGEI